jgi:hypothetical protein
MTSRYSFLLLFLSILTITIAVPLPDGKTQSTDSVAQHIGRAGLWALGGLAAIGLSLGSITYGTNWWHRFKTLQAEFDGNKMAWDATQARKEQEHQKKMEALDVILDVVKNYTDTVGLVKTEFGPFAIADDLEAGIEDAKVNVDKVGGGFKC